MSVCVCESVCECVTGERGRFGQWEFGQQVPQSDRMMGSFLLGSSALTTTQAH